MAALVLELHLVCLRPLYDGAPVGAVQAQVTHLVLEVVVPPPLHDVAAGTQLGQLGEGEGVVVVVGAPVLLRVGGRGFEPGQHLVIGESVGVEGDEVGAGEGELTGHVGVGHLQDPFVFRALDLEVIGHVHHPTAQSRQLALHVDHIAPVQVEGVIIIRIGAVPGGEVNPHQRGDRGHRLGVWRWGRGVVGGVFGGSVKADGEFHLLSLLLDYKEIIPDQLSQKPVWDTLRPGSA